MTCTDRMDPSERALSPVVVLCAASGLLLAGLLLVTAPAVEPSPAELRQVTH